MGNGDPLPCYNCYEVYRGDKLIQVFPDKQKAFDYCEKMYYFHPSLEHTIYEVRYQRLAQQVLYVPGM